MDKLDNFLGKNVTRMVYVIGILLIVGYFRGCGYSSDVNTNKKNTTAIVEKLDSLIKINPNVKWMMELQQLQTEKNAVENARDMLFNEAAIDSKKLSPDQVLNEYNKKIKILDSKIKSLYEQQ